MELLEERIAELGQRLRESEEARQKSVSPLSWNGYVDFGFFVPLGNGGVGWVRDSGPTRQFPQYSQLRVGVPGRHPRDAGQHARRGRRTWATRPD